MKSLITILFSAILSVYPQQLYEKQIVPFDGLESDYFGRAIAVSDSFLFISSLRYSNHVDNAVYIYRLLNNDYIFEYKIHPSIPQPGISGELFGSNLLFKDGRLFVGAQNKKINNIPVGALYIFEYENYQWVEKQKIIPPEPHSYGELFSNAISVYNEYLLVSAFRADAGAEDAGKVFIYKYVNKGYSLQQELVPYDPKDYQFFGTSVEIKDEIIFIGSSLDSTESGLGSGSVYVYVKEDSSWTFSRKYIPEPNSEHLAFGCSMALNNDYIFIGTTDNVYYNSPGKVYIYKYSGPSLDLMQIIETGDNYFDDRFGISLFVKGDSLIVSAIFDTVKNENPGAAYLFVNENSGWKKKYKLFPSDEINASWFAGRCIIKDDKIFIGAHRTRVNNIRPGVVYIYSSEPLSVVNENIYDINNFYLSQNYPNPFNSSTRIDFYIPNEGRVKIKIYDITGKELKTILDEIKEPNYYSLNINFEEFPSGIYFYRIEYFYMENNCINHSFLTKKAVLIK